MSLLFALLFATPARAEKPVEEIYLAELDRIRGEVAGQVQLAAYDLIDEMVYGMTKEPVFNKPTAVVLAGVTVPVGQGSHLGALVENHLQNVLQQNPQSNIQLVHCPSCTAVIVHSGPEGTVVSRGIDNPKVLQKIGNSSNKHALFIDVEAEGAWLVLRARLTLLDPDLPIVWSHTLATSGGTPALLRESSHLKSAAEARKEYLQILKGNGPIQVPIRVGVRTYARPSGSGLGPPPFLWLQSGIEIGTKTRGWTSSMMVGYSFFPQAYQGILGQVRVKRLLTGRARSVTRPDLYIFAGGAVVSVWGPATAGFLDTPLNVMEVIDAADGRGPRTAFGTFQIGADLRIGRRIGFSAFLESIPNLGNSQNLGKYMQPFGIPIQTIGVEVSLWF